LSSGKEEPRTSQGKRGNPKKADRIIPSAKTTDKPKVSKRGIMTPIERIRAAESQTTEIDTGIDIRKVMADNAAMHAEIVSLRSKLDIAEQKLAYYEGRYLC